MIGLGMRVFQFIKGVRTVMIFSIGIELEGCDEEDYSNVQYAVLAKVSVAIEASYPNITAQNTQGHSDIAAGRKTDPGPFFNWQKYRQMWQAIDLKAKKIRG